MFPILPHCPMNAGSITRREANATKVSILGSMKMPEAVLIAAVKNKINEHSVTILLHPFLLINTTPRFSKTMRTMTAERIKSRGS